MKHQCFFQRKQCLGGRENARESTVNTESRRVSDTEGELEVEDVGKRIEGRTEKMVGGKHCSWKQIRY